jgi:hypothetical protein
MVAGIWGEVKGKMKREFFLMAVLSGPAPHSRLRGANCFPDSDSYLGCVKHHSFYLRSLANRSHSLYQSDSHQGTSGSGSLIASSLIQCITLSESVLHSTMPLGTPKSKVVLLGHGILKLFYPQLF